MRTSAEKSPSETIAESELARKKEDANFERVQSEEDDRASQLAAYDISTYPADFTLQVVVDKMDNQKITIPGYQRKFVWTKTQASRLVESFILGLPVPPIYVYQDPSMENVLEVIDGQQRIKSIRYFFSGYFGEEQAGKRETFRLVGLAAESPYANKSYSELDEGTRTKLQDTAFRAFIIRQHKPTGKAAVFHVFERLNTGGTLLAGQEIRNCLLHGKLNDLLMDVNRNPDWRSIFGAKDAQKHLRDVELVLRFLALHFALKQYKKPMKDFMSDFMDEHRNPTEEELRNYREVFASTCSTILAHLGAKPFHLVRGLNAAAFDAVFVAVARHQGTVPADLSDRYDRLKQDSNFQTLVRSGTTDEKVVAERLELASRILLG